MVIQASRDDLSLVCIENNIIHLPYPDITWGMPFQQDVDNHMMHNSASAGEMTRFSGRCRHLGDRWTSKVRKVEAQQKRAWKVLGEASFGRWRAIC